MFTEDGLSTSQINSVATLKGKGSNCEVFHYHLDHLSTPTDLTDEQGNTVRQALYRSYGNIARQHVEDIPNPLRFQGQYFDSETGLHYNRHRYYSPDTGRFITAAPIGLAGGLNSYRYAPNPVNWIVPLGLTNIPPNGPCKNKIIYVDSNGGAKFTLNKYWNKVTIFKGRKVFQRNALFNLTTIDDKGRTHSARMRRGLAPIGFDSEPVNLHHLIQTEPGNIAEVSGTFHSTNTKTLHIKQMEKQNGNWRARKNYSF